MIGLSAIEVTDYSEPTLPETEEEKAAGGIEALKGKEEPADVHIFPAARTNKHHSHQHKEPTPVSPPSAPTKPCDKKKC